MEVGDMVFETLRDKLSALDVPEGHARRLVWVVPNRLGAAITARGSFEIFLAGPELVATSPVVAKHLQHDSWEPSDGGADFSATRVMLGSAPHFAAMAALIAIELARFELATDEAMQAAFSEVEPIIEMAIRRGALSTETLIGLIAELQVLRVALLSTAPTERQMALMGWRGWMQGRDFVFGRHSIEVKATLGEVSRHSFSGVHQLEPQPLSDGNLEVLHLMSFGLAEVNEGGQCLPELVEYIASLLDYDSPTPRAVRDQFLMMVQQYGGGGSPGYDHDTMCGWSVYQARYAITFARLYSVDDPEMRLLTSEVLDQTFAIPGSVSFDLQLPSRVSHFNPATNWQSEIAALATS